MLAVAVIVFREVLEAALVVGIVLAASRGVPRRGKWVAAGIGCGVLLALTVAAFTGEIASAVNGIGQELFNAAILFTAVLMLGWHNVWMSRHAKEHVAEATRVGREVLVGARPLYALAMVCGLAVAREGSEIVLFVYGIIAAQGGSAVALLTGGAFGMIVGIAIGAALYLGLLTIPLRHLFTVTSWLILLLAAGMASQGAAFLLQADLVPPLGNLWDTSGVLSEQSLLGQALHALIGYVARPTGIQLVFYLGTVVLIAGLMRLFGGGGGGRSGTAPAE
ncbi:MAG TPA: FTR1 family protein [Stellaceae bacterium]|jgi:high-affinity iron transporter|nr:FTR1 family protein [Stellaceae bacterium]